MYQWVEDSKSETQKTLGGGEETVTTYTYKKEWRRATGAIPPISSRPTSTRTPTCRSRASASLSRRATLGAFTVDGKAVADLGTDSPVKLRPISSVR